SFKKHQQSFLYSTEKQHPNVGAYSNTPSAPTIASSRRHNYYYHFQKKQRPRWKKGDGMR
ncbi:MAG: hypothetical protein OIF50_03175, partial [Flavobacteriaceae bacterium]|nr:hypothetical protein [Flavobacteriaceae bacterium]